MAFAFFFESVGGGEWLVLLAVVLIVAGPKNLPSIARKIGETMAHLRRAADEFKRQLMTMDQEVQNVVSDVKQDYMNIGQEVNDAVADDGTSNPPDYSSEEYGVDGDPNGDSGDDSDRAMWESYGRDYDEDSTDPYDNESPGDEAAGEDAPDDGAGQDGAVGSEASSYDPETPKTGAETVK